MFDVITIGSATMDAFIESDEANIVSVNSVQKNVEFMAFPYGAKLEIDDFSRSLGGGGINTAVNFANLGLKASTIIKMGNDDVKDAICEMLGQKHVNTKNAICTDKIASGFSIILVSFQGDRTVLAHRGANAFINESDINFEAIKNSRWLYVAPLAGKSGRVLDKLAYFAEENGVHLAINAGTTAIKKGEKYFSKILETAEILVLNKEEASMLTKIHVRPDTKNEKYSSEIIHPDVRAMLMQLRGANHTVVVITDGKNGVFAYDGTKFYACPAFHAKIRSTLGAGDAFASTFTAAIDKTNWDIEKSLKMASINSASVIESFSAQDGLLTFKEIEKRLKQNPDYKIQIME